MAPPLAADGDGGQDPFGAPLYGSVRPARRARRCGAAPMQGTASTSPAAATDVLTAQRWSADGPCSVGRQDERRRPSPRWSGPPTPPARGRRFAGRRGGTAPHAEGGQVKLRGLQAYPGVRGCAAAVGPSGGTFDAVLDGLPPGDRRWRQMSSRDATAGDPPWADDHRWRDKEAAAPRLPRADRSAQSVVPRASRMARRRSRCTPRAQAAAPCFG